MANMTYSSDCPAPADNNRPKVKGYSSNAVALLLALNVSRKLPLGEG
jgi:hypothetical protein